MTDSSGASPAHVSRFSVEKDEFLQNALEDQKLRQLVFYIENELEKFLRDSNMSKIQFPDHLSDYQQSLVLSISNRFGLDGYQNPLILTKRLESAIPRTSLKEYWQDKTRSQARVNRVTGRGVSGSHRSTTQHKVAGAAPPNNTWQQGYNNNSFANNYQSYSNPYASHTQSIVTASNSHQKPRSAPSDPNQLASYDNPYAAAPKAQTKFTAADLDQWVKSNNRKKQREESKKQKKKAKAKAKTQEAKTQEAKKKLDTDRAELNSKVPFFPDKPFDKKVTDSYRDRRPARWSRSNRRGRSSNQPRLPSHILHMTDFDTCITTPEFAPRNSETIRQSLNVFKSAKSPRNPFYHMCWNHNTLSGCPREGKCNWIHCFVGVMDETYEMDNTLLAYQNEHSCEILFVNPKVTLVTFSNESDALLALQSNQSDSSMFQLHPYSKATTEQLSSDLPDSFFGNESKI